MKIGIIGVGMHEISRSVLEAFQRVHPEVQIVQINESISNQFKFDKEAISIVNMNRIEENEYSVEKQFEIEPSKFIGKPRNNFKKR